MDGQSVRVIGPSVELASPLGRKVQEGGRREGRWKCKATVRHVKANHVGEWQARRGGRKRRNEEAALPLGEKGQWPGRQGGAGEKDKAALQVDRLRHEACGGGGQRVVHGSGTCVGNGRRKDWLPMLSGLAEQQRACPSVQCAPACQICSAPNTHHTLLWVHHQTSSMCHPAVATTPPDLSPHNSFHQQIAKNGQNCKTTANHLKNLALITRLPSH